MRAVRWVVGALGDLFVTAGLLLLLFVAWQLWWTDVEADRVQSGTVQALTRDFGNHDEPAGSAVERPAGDFGKAFAILRIPRLGADYARPVLEGTGTDTLQRGVGHYDGTAKPGAVGNFAIAGHRTTYGRPFHDIDRLRKGDTIVVETKSGYSVYAVDRHLIVSPTAVDVIAPVPGQPGAKADGAWLTMTACHPKYSAAQRYVVVSKLVHTYTRAQGMPAGTLTAPSGADS